MSESILCPVCGAAAEVFLERRQVPLQQNLPVATEAEAGALGRGDLRMRVCPQCAFVFNGAFDPALLRYTTGYDNNQLHSPEFRRHVEQRLAHLLGEGGVRGTRVVEVGCGNGAFLRMLVDAPGSGVRGFGFDPAYEGPESDREGRLTFRRAYYGPEFASIAADVVVCRHVIEHVPDPLALLRTIRQALGGRPEARVFFETPCVEWILRNRVLWDFFYEHCSLFTARSLASVFRRAGFHVEGVEHVFGGQYLWLEARPSPAAEPPGDRPEEVPRLARGYGEAERRIRAEWEARVAGWARAGRLAIWGAGAKGVTFANLLDPDRVWIDCVVDLNPNKQGRYVPGTGHPIVPPAALAERRVARAVLMNPNYRAENEALLRELRLDVQLVE